MADTVYGGYQALSPMHTSGSGTAQWTRARLDRRDCFLKRFLLPVYPVCVSGPLARLQAERCESFEQRKRRLYEAAACVLGDGLVPVFDFFRYDQHYYAASPWIDAQPITRAAKIGSLGMNTLLWQAAQCLLEMHRAGIVHADLKPEHLLVEKQADKPECVRLIDLDSAFLPRIEQPRVPECDPVYAAPESVLALCGQDIALTSAIDCFAFAVVCHEALSGSLPQVDRTRYRYLHESVLDGAAPVLAAEIPRSVRSVLQAMLEADPANRPTDSEVERLLASLPQPVWERTAKKQRRPNGLSEFLRR